MLLLSAIVVLAYSLLIGSFVWGFDKVNVFKLAESPPKTSFSVVIPFRNEAENLPGLLESISKLKYPKHKFEIIFVDDDSNDGSTEIIERFFLKFRDDNTKDFDCTQPDVRVIKNERTSNSPKKDAITTAVKQAKNEWIMTTDADCILPEFWLNSFDAFIQKKHPKCIAGPVTYQSARTFFEKFQLLDFLSLQGATIGGFGLKKPFMCNGANFAYQKSLFKALNGFDGNSNIASGDDVFFLEKVATTYPKDLNYLKCEQAVVVTKPQPTWSSLIQQRIRWASKASGYKNTFGKLTGLIVLMANALILVLGLLCGLDLFEFKILFYFLMMKFVIDAILIYKSAIFFNKKEALLSYLSAFLVYPFFSVYVALLSMFKTYKWKNRNFRK
ncbi:glycosyltransferase [Seonamhaeicola sp. ML3]|uniref:glycosyltransferase family 2 protein n=1 Tax=Seonamhaeicola sp. ML3 TaxID=2937786 RepID=UPI00200D75C1|nr:glycosyltransferase [Seonamhaeicola sp. ML3]